MIDSGLVAAGYKYLNMDEGWAKKERLVGLWGLFLCLPSNCPTELELS